MRGIIRYFCCQLPVVHHSPPTTKSLSGSGSPAVPCLQLLQGQEGDLGVQGKGEVGKQSRAMAAWKHTGSPLPAKGIVFRPAWRKEGKWRWTVLFRLSIPQQTCLGSSALWSSLPASVTQHPSVRRRSFPKELKSSLLVTSLSSEGMLLFDFWESWWSNRLMLWLLFKGMPGRGQVTGRWLFGSGLRWEA